MQGYFRLILTGAVMLGVTLSQTTRQEAESISAVYSRGALRVSLAVDLPRSGEGALRMEVLDPEDAVVGLVERVVTARAGSVQWVESIVMGKATALDALVWHRLRYRFTFQDGEAGPEGVVSISRVLQQPLVHVVSQNRYLRGAPAAVRMVVTDARSGKSISSGDVRVSMGEHVLFSGKLNVRGTAKAEFVFPASLTGKQVLRYTVDTDSGQAEHEQPVLLEDRPAILLTTEKPVYQPGQTIHVRALGRDLASQRAAANRKLTFELEDSRGNKVLRQRTQTDDYGIASTEFVLAEEVNLGTYRLLASINGENSAEMTVRVERYVLPRFEVRIDLAGKNKGGYRPGDRVKGTVHAKYFFGKPVNGAEVKVRVMGTDEADSSMQGVADGAGALPFELRLPGVGAPGVSIEATVKDKAGHVERRTEEVTVSEWPIQITAIPEGGTVVPGMETEVLVVTTYADGSPAKTEVRMQAKGQERVALTDDSGVASILLRRDGGTNLRLEARDKEGNRASVPVSLPLRGGTEHLLLRAQQAVYRVGDSVAVEVLSSKRTGSVFLDVIKGRQTVATYDADLVNGRAVVQFGTTEALAGLLELHAYWLSGKGRPVGDRRMVFVHPARELRIATSLDKAVYKPGEEARIGFHVTDTEGKGVASALGLEIVDEAVFALAEKRPGLAKVFFHLGQEWTKTRRGMGSLLLADVISVEGQERAARALFSAAGMRAEVDTATFRRGVPQSRYAEYAARYQEKFLRQMGAIALGAAEDEVCDQARVAAWVRNRDERDAWGNPLGVDDRRAGTRFFTVRSAGPDGSYFTGDDLVQQREDRKCVEPVGWGQSGLGLRVERNVRLGRRAEIIGVVTDATGAVIAQAEVRLVGSNGEAVRRLTADGEGRFHIADIVAGRYELWIASPGFRIGRRWMELREQDRAVTQALLEVGSVTESVEVRAALPLLNTSTSMAVAVKKKAMPPAIAQTHVRQWFPESLFVMPRILTDGQGRASVTVPIADSITTWRLGMLASTKNGDLGSGEARLKVFQDFFVEVDLPVRLTEGDRVSIPIAVYNYTGAKGDVLLRLEESDWFRMTGEDREKRIVAEAGGVTGSEFSIEAHRIGKFQLKLTAEMTGGVRRADVVVREIEIVPNGQEVSVVQNGALEGKAEHRIVIPSNAIAGTEKVFVRLHPGPLSEVVEGMDAILRAPYGCFEQTSSVTYPNVLALDYMKRTKKLNQEVQSKASAFIGTGYQRLLTFEVPGGGFSWFGQAPANKILTAYGLMEFHDMAKVHEVDGRVLTRTQRWLAGLQQQDGSWAPDGNFINEGVTDRYNSHRLRITAYVAWALASSGYQGPELERAWEYLSRSEGKMDAYTLAVTANFAVEHGRGRPFASQAIRQLLDARVDGGEETWWIAEETGFFGRGQSAMVETTGLAVQALLRWGEAPQVAREAMRFLTGKKDASGTWGTTQATIMALRALLLAADKGAADAVGKVRISVNGEPAGEVALTTENHDLLHQIVLPGSTGANRVRLQFEGKGTPSYQVVGRYFVPWLDHGERELLTMNVGYNRRRVKEGDLVEAVATVRNHSSRTVHMPMVELGIPPGFELLADDLEAFRGKRAGRKSGGLQKYTTTPVQATLYFDGVDAGDTLRLRYRLRAKHAMRGKTFASRAYEYYDRTVGGVAPPVELEVRKR